MAAKDKKITKLLLPLVESLREAMGENLIAVMLFGSRARGKTKKASDWDIFILAHSLPLAPMKRYAYCFRVRLQGQAFLSRQSWKSNAIRFLVGVPLDPRFTPRVSATDGL